MKNCFPFGIKALTLLLKQWMLLIYFGKWPFEFNLLDTGRVPPFFNFKSIIHRCVWYLHELHDYP